MEMRAGTGSNDRFARNRIHRPKVQPSIMDTLEERRSLVTISLIILCDQSYGRLLVIAFRDQP